MPLKYGQLCKWFYCTGNRKLQRKFSSVWDYLVRVKYQKFKRGKTRKDWLVMEAKTSKRNTAGWNLTTLSTIPRVVVELPLKYFKSPQFLWRIWRQSPLAFGRRFFRGFGSVLIPKSMAYLVIVTAHLPNLNALFCLVHNFVKLPSTSLQFGRAAGDKWAMWMF